MKFKLFRTCNCYNCENELLTLPELKSRTCYHHLEMAEDEDNFIGVCWYCGNITLVESRHWDRRFREYQIPSKYIFSKGCRECTGDPEANIRWMTILPEAVIDPITGIRNREELTDIAVAEITHQNNSLFTEYHKESTA